jgi:hypothetical protein
VVALKDHLILAQLLKQAQSAEAQGSGNATQEGTAAQVTPPEEVRQFLAHQLERAGEGEAPVLSAPAAALLSQLREQTTVSPQALAQLTQERVQTVMTALTANTAVAASRLQLSQEKRRGRDGAEVRYLLQAQGGS